MKSLKEYPGMDVTLVDTNNKIWNGHVVMYSPENDFGDGEEESIVLKDNNSGRLIEFEKTEILKIM